MVLKPDSRVVVVVVVVVVVQGTGTSLEYCVNSILGTSQEIIIAK